MRVGVYVDGFNLYYGAHAQMGSRAGWKWIDLRGLASRYATWSGATVDRVIYCTARVNDPDDPGQTSRQDFYLKALLQSGSADVIDVLKGRVDAAIVISNDSDLALPIRVARDHVPVGLINPGNKPLAGALKGEPADGVGGHWWRRLGEQDLVQCQLPDPVGQIRKPVGW